MTRAKFRRLFWVLGGIGIGTGWFIYTRQADFGPYPIAADAVSYSRISESFRSFSEAFTYAGDRTFGFPFFLYFVKRVVGLFAAPDPETLVKIQSVFLFALHLGTSLFFGRSLSRICERSDSDVPSLTTGLVSAHPGLVALTTVLLSDTFATDLIMIASALTFRGRAKSLPKELLRGCAAGVLLGYATAARPFFIVSLAAVFMVSVFLVARRAREFSPFSAAFAVAAMSVLLPAATHCHSLYGTACLQNPAFANGAAGQSLQMGLTSYRTYWSKYSPWPSTIVIPDDPALAGYRTTCDVAAISTPGSWVRCAATRPFFFPIYVVKKMIAVFDFFFLHPYASDVSPAWTRRYDRVWNVLSFVGFFCALGLVAAWLRRGEYWKSFGFAFPICALFFQLPMHVEGRYAFPAVPFSVFAFLEVSRRLGTRGSRRYYFLTAVAALAVLFLVQTAQWDREDQVLQRIESGSP